MIKAVIFDCFGVLVTDGWHPFKFKHFGNNPEKNIEASRINDLSNKGAISYGEFLSMMGELANITAKEVESEISNNAPNKQLFDFISEIKPNYKIGMLSNAAENWLDKLLEPEQLAQFDATVLSCDISVNKPEKAAYVATAKSLGCDVSECLFVDDILSYVVAARDAGMKAVHYRDPQQAIKEIKALIN